DLQSTAHDEPPGRPPVVSLHDVYGFNPLSATVPATSAAHVLGAQINLWTEYMPTFARDQHAIFPRMAAFAESAWSPAAGRDWQDFLARMPAELARYRSLGIVYADSAFAPRFDLTLQAGGKLQVSLQDQSGYGELHYTLDGSAPTAHSARYEQSLELSPPAQLQAAAFAADGMELSALRQQTVDLAALRSRDSDALATCADKLVLRIEDDRPLEGPRPVYRTDIMDMCWQWKAAPLDGIGHIKLTLGNMPWNYQLAHDITGVVQRPDSGAPSVEIHLDACDGHRLASLSLAEAAKTDLQTTLTATLPPTQGSHDLCILVTGSPVQSFWGLDRVELLP
ncbi:MAG TPA: family 20 glycosylhydrolase, partial [Gammaproteobacteria bacterium]